MFKIQIKSWKKNLFQNFVSVLVSSTWRIVMAKFLNELSNLFYKYLKQFFI
jgi:hypothetical protein